MKFRTYSIFAGLLLAAAVCANANSGPKKGGSSYGDASDTDTACGSLCGVLPAGVTVFAQNYSYSDGPGNVYSFQITSTTTDFSITLTGTEPFTSVPGDYPFGVFVAPIGGFTPGGNDPTAFTTASADASAPPANIDSVTFYVTGNGGPFVFYAIESGSGTVSADVSLTSSTSSTPEPGLFPILGIGIAGGALLHWRRRRKLA